MNNVSTSKYQFAHGKRPSGVGYWAFFFDGNDDVMAAKFFSGKYSEAKAQAVAYAKANGHTFVEVGS